MNNTTGNDSFYQTTDVALCAALCCNGYQIEEIEKISSNRSVFLVRRDDKLGETIRLYFAHKLRVEPISFFNCLKEIKTRIYNA